MSEALLKDAVRLHQAGQLLEAARLYGAVLRASPRNFQALYLQRLAAAGGQIQQQTA